MDVTRFDNPVDTTEPLFVRRFSCRYPTMLAKDIDEIKSVGLYSTGDKRLDKEVINAQMTNAMLTINEMVELYRKDCPVYIRSREDTVTIYELIMDHLLVWSRHLDRGINISKAPIEDLILLDEFAENIFQYVRYEYKKSNVQNELHRRISSLNRYNAVNILKKPLYLQQPKLTVDVVNVSVDEEGVIDINKKDPDDDLPKRNSLANMLKESLMYLKG